MKRNKTPLSISEVGFFIIGFGDSERQGYLVHFGPGEIEIIFRDMADILGKGGIKLSRLGQGEIFE